MYIPLVFEKYLDKASLERIEKSVAVAENKTDAEIVPVLVKRSSDTYSFEARLYTLLLIFLFFLNPLMMCVPVCIIAFLVLRRINTLKDRDVKRRALEEFYFNSFHNVKKGVMIFVSYEDRQIEVVAEESVAKEYDEKTWEQISHNFSEKMRSYDLEEAFTSSVLMLGDILAEKFPATYEKNELSNHLIIKE